MLHKYPSAKFSNRNGGVWCTVYVDENTVFDTVIEEGDPKNLKKRFASAWAAFNAGKAEEPVKKDSNEGETATKERDEPFIPAVVKPPSIEPLNKTRKRKKAK